MQETQPDQAREKRSHPSHDPGNRGAGRQPLCQRHGRDAKAQPDPRYVSLHGRGESQILEMARPVDVEAARDQLAVRTVRHEHIVPSILLAMQRHALRTARRQAFDGVRRAAMAHYGNQLIVANLQVARHLHGFVNLNERVCTRAIPVQQELIRVVDAFFGPDPDRQLWLFRLSHPTEQEPTDAL